MRAYGISHIGNIRETNQDAYFIKTDDSGSLQNLYIVADGMGGHLAGEIASNTAIKKFYEYILTQTFTHNNILDFLTEATKYANLQVYEASKKNLDYFGMGTTFTALTISNNKGYAVHIGDSRVYLISDENINLITTDHSFTNEMKKLGKLSDKAAINHPNRHVLTRALGTENNTLVDGFTFNVKKDDRVLVCTDGLTNMISDNEIKNIILANTLEKAANNLVLLANKNGGDDNITAILIEIEGDEHVT